MNLSSVRYFSEELKSIIEKLVDNHKGDDEAKEIVRTLALYVLSNSMDIRSYLFDEQYAYLGSRNDKLKEIINRSIDYLSLVLAHKDFSGIILGSLENDLKLEIYSFLKGKLADDSINRDNFADFVDYLHITYDRDVILDILKARITYDKEKKEEFKALLEYMTFNARDYIEEDELDRLEKAINFRQNLLKNFNIEYFMINFFILKNFPRLFPEEYHSPKYFYNHKFIKDMKNLVLDIERDKAHSLHVRSDAGNMVHRQLKLIQENQKHISELRGKGE